jgi:hypothetical protein
MSSDYMLTVIAFLAIIPLVALQTTTTCLSRPISLVLSNCSGNVQGLGWGWGIELAIGEGRDAPKACLMPSTVVNTTLIMSSELCQESVRTRYKKYPNMTEAQCRSRAGGVLDREAFSQFNIEVKKDELKEQNPAWWKIMTDEQRDRDPFPHVMSVPVHLSDDNITTHPYIHVWVKEGENHSMHHLGLGDNSNFLHSLVEPGLILPQWSLNVGSRSAEYPRSGALVLGGYDKNGIEGSFVTYSIKEPGVRLVQRPCPLQTKMTKVVVNISVNGTSRQVEPYDPTNVPGACIEP